MDGSCQSPPAPIRLMTLDQFGNGNYHCRTMHERPCRHCEDAREVRLLPDSGTHAELRPSELPHLQHLERIPCTECTAKCAVCREVVVDVELDAAGWCRDCAAELESEPGSATEAA
jgi:hypothetical protein